MKKTGIYYCIIFILLLSGCKALRLPEEKERPAMRYTSAIQSKIKNSNRPQHLLISNGSLKIYDENQMNLRVTMYINKDNFIFASGRYMGFEIFRLQISEDSVKFINRFQRTYFFGKKEEIRNQLVKELEINDIQELIYTGIILYEDKHNEYLSTNFKKEDNSIRYQRILDEGIKVEMEYDLNVFLKDILFSDHVNSMYLDMDITRSEAGLESLQGTYFKNNYKIEFEFDTNGFSEEPYSNTDFKVGNNYNEVRSIL